MSVAADSDALRCALAAIAAVDPGALVTRALAEHRLGPRVSLIAVGKAAEQMATAAVEALGDSLLRAIVIAPPRAAGVARENRPESRAAIATYLGGHPIPSEAGMRGASAVLQMARTLGADDVLLCLISGGGSALMTIPPDGISLDDIRFVTDALLRSGADIEELNCVRKHLDQLKGGRLAALTFPAAVSSLVLSDVVGDPIATIASGPTVPDPSTIEDACRVLHYRGVWETMPRSVRSHLESGHDESPKPGDPRLENCTTRVIGNNRIAADAACATARSLGYEARLATTAMTGEAREAGTEIVSKLRREREVVGAPVALVFAGETTVTVRGHGVGGRNQELALAAALAMDGDPSLRLVSIGTDGIDGPTDAAGAVADGTTVQRARDVGRDASAALEANDSYSFWKAVGGHVVTGPTGTNVMDIVVATASIGTPLRV